jgi:hypothetical protein
MATKETIDSITSEQEAMVPVYLERYLKIGLNTEPCNRPAAEAAVAVSYKVIGGLDPQFVWADSPFQGARIAAQIAAGTTDVTRTQIQAQTELASFGSLEACWVTFYAFITEQLPVESNELVKIAQNIVSECGIYWTFEKTVVMTDRPIAIHMDNGVLSNSNGYAIEYKDGTGVYAYKGTLYSSLSELKITTKMAV